MRRIVWRRDVTPFIGRVQEKADLDALLRRDDVHMITLTGAGGTGKSRLSTEVGGAVLDLFVDGVFQVQLSTVTEPRLVPPTTDTAPIVAQICRQVDGLPLAIELAASQLRVLDPAALLERMNERLGALGRDDRALDRRRRTLGDVISWSYDLLDETERHLFRRVSVFGGGFGLEAAQAVCADGPRHEHVLNKLTSLARKSLLLRDMVEGEPRLRILETVREYSREKLKESGEYAELRGRRFLRHRARCRRAPATARAPRRLRHRAHAHGARGRGPARRRTGHFEEALVCMRAVGNTCWMGALLENLAHARPRLPRQAGRSRAAVGRRRRILEIAGGQVRADRPGGVRAEHRDRAGSLGTFHVRSAVRGGHAVEQSGGDRGVDFFAYPTPLRSAVALSLS